MRPRDLANPEYYSDGTTTEFELVWSKDSTVAVLHVLCGGSKHRIKMTIEQVDLLAEFLANNIDN